ncbi:MAG: hypothetical protein K9N21_17320 [Deltaproteobacteria bacterium]|nr:hypothetical protein [Deltaproteobacteria bacterium]
MQDQNVNHTNPASSIQHPASKRYLFDNPRNVKILLGCFYASLLVLLIIEWFVHKHPHFDWEAWPEFYAVYGFVACVVLVVAAKYILRPLVKRREDYYD